MRLIAILVTALALAGCSAEWYAQRDARAAAERNNPAAYDTSMQDYAAFMSVVQGMRGPQMDPSSVLFMQPRHYPPLIGGRTCTRFGTTTVC